MKIKIVHLFQCVGGGVEVYVQMLLSRLDKEKFDNIVICSLDSNPEDYSGFAQVIQIEMVSNLSPSKDGKAIKKVRSLLKDINPDLLYCHSSKAGGIGRIAAIGLKIPVIYNPHGWAFCMEGSRLKSSVYLWIERLLAFFTTRIIAISNYERTTAIEHRIAKPQKITTIFNGIDFDKIKQQLSTSTVSRQTLEISKDAWVVGMVGRISRQKAPDTFVKVAKQVKQQIPNAEFIIVGDGDMRSLVEEQIEEYGLSDCFHITGWVNNAVAYANLFNQGMLLSRWEGFGLAVAEYMALGVPVIATECQGLKDLIRDHDNGLLVPVDDVSRATESVVETYKNASFRESMIRNGLVRVEALFDLKRTVKEHERLFDEISKKSYKS